jgi:IPT/TIG domain
MKLFVRFPGVALVPLCVLSLFLVACGGTSGNTTGVTAPVPLPAISAVTPSTIPAGSLGAVQITITGNGFIATSVAQINGTILTTTYVSATELQASIPASLIVAGMQLGIVVSNGNSSSANSAASLVSVLNPVPSLVSLAPTGVIAGSGPQTVTVTGTGFVPTTSIAANSTARTTTYASPTQVTVALTAADLASAGAINLVATNAAPGGGSSSALSFAVNNPAPAIVSLNPTTIAEGSAAFTLNVAGSGFVGGSVVYWNQTALTTTLVSATALQAAVPASLLASASSSSITVVNSPPGGGQSATAAFAVTSALPILSALRPATVEIYQAAAVNLSGSGFGPDSVALWNGAPRPTMVVSASQLAVSLSASDLAATGTGKITVSNPAPGGGVTKALSLTITDLPIPTITGLSFSVPSSYAGVCPQVQVHAVGTSLSGTQLAVNGQTLASSQATSDTDLYGTLPVAFSSAPGQFSAVAIQPYFQLNSDPYLLPSTATPVLTFCASPAGATIYPNSKFLLSFAATEINLSSAPAVTSITLPAGITTSATFPISTGQGYPGSAHQVFTAASSLASGTPSFPFTGSAGTLSSTGTVTLTVSSTPAAPTSFSSFPFSELGVPIGGSNSLAFISTGQNQDYALDLAVSGLPAGTTATITPTPIIPGDSFTVTVAAASTAPESQNVPITITGTPSLASVTSSTGSFSLDVTPRPGTLANSRTDFVSTQATPFGVAYDRQADLIFASNSVWNRIDVISNKTHQLQQSIPLRGAQAIDVSQDGSTVWIGTDSPQVFALNTSTFALTRYLLPTIAGSGWEDNLLLALSDGTLLLNTSPTTGDGTYDNVIWTPSTNQLTVLPSSDYVNLRSGDGSKAYGTTYASGYSNVVYDVATKTLTPLPELGQSSQVIAANNNGSMLVGGDNKLYTGAAQLIGAIPEYLGNYYAEQHGSTAFSRDGTTLYQIGAGADSRIATIDVASLTLRGVAPALGTLPNFVSETPVNTSNASVDDSGMMIGIQTFGVGFEDSTFFQNFGTSTRGATSPVLLTPNAGPLAGGTVSSPYGSFDLTPDVWYGANRGSASIDAIGDLTITSPAGNANGPVNLKYIYPDGEQVFTPQAFSYSSFPQDSILSGATPFGGVPGRISGYGMPADGSGGTLTVGGQTAAITTTAGQYPPYTGEAFPSTYLDYTIPSGTPGYADLSITTPIGSGTLPKAVFYAKSVTDYSSADSFSDVLYDSARQQLYLSGTDHIDVFSLTSNSWQTPLKPATLGSASQFRGLALSPDGTQLLATNLLDQSLSVISIDTTSQTFAIAIPPPSSSGQGCLTGPFAVTALAGQQALVSSGLPPTIGGCPYAQTLYVANLQARTVSQARAQSYVCSTVASTSEGTADGTLAIVGAEGGGSCLYSVTSNSFIVTQSGSINYYGVGISGDGNIASVSNAFVDPSGNMLGGLGRPAVLFPNQLATPYPLNDYPSNTLQRPRLNASGSLYYWAYPNYFEIFDVPTATLKMRFSLAETIQNVETPLAIDEGGRQIFLITDKGLTIIDLGTAPLSIGHIDPVSGAASQVQVRGSGFVSGLSAMIDQQSATTVFVDENTFKLTVPTMAAGNHDLTITNPDGSTYTLKSAISVQ